MKDFTYILGIDPGNHYGIAYCRVDVENNVQVNFTHCYDLDKYKHQLNHQSFAQIPKYYVLRHLLHSVFTRFDIFLCCIEKAYVNIKYPLAAQSVIENVAYSSSIIQQLSIRPPLLIHNKSIKKCLCGSYHVSKEDIKQAILSNPKINLTLFHNDATNKDKYNLTEHEYDAIATVYTLLHLVNIF